MSFQSSQRGTSNMHSLNSPMERTGVIIYKPASFSTTTTMAARQLRQTPAHHVLRMMILLLRRSAGKGLPQKWPPVSLAHSLLDPRNKSWHEEFVLVPLSQLHEGYQMRVSSKPLGSYYHWAWWEKSGLRFARLNAQVQGTE